VQALRVDPVEGVGDQPHDQADEKLGDHREDVDCRHRLDEAAGKKDGAGGKALAPKPAGQPKAGGADDAHKQHHRPKRAPHLAPRQPLLKDGIQRQYVKTRRQAHKAQAGHGGIAAYTRTVGYRGCGLRNGQVEIQPPHGQSDGAQRHEADLDPSSGQRADQQGANHRSDGH